MKKPRRSAVKAKPFEWVGYACALAVGFDLWLKLSKDFAKEIKAASSLVESIKAKNPCKLFYPYAFDPC